MTSGSFRCPYKLNKNYLSAFVASYLQIQQTKNTLNYRGLPSHIVEVFKLKGNRLVTETGILRRPRRDLKPSRPKLAKNGSRDWVKNGSRDQVSRLHHSKLLPTMMVIKYRYKLHPDDWDISANCTQYFCFLFQKHVISRYTILCRL